MTLPPVLFVHGMWADQTYWNRFRRSFERNGLATHSITLLCHEKPQDIDGLRRVGILDYVAQVRDVALLLPEPPVVVGHSMGALVAQKLAETTAIHSLVLLSPVGPSGISPVRPTVLLCAGGNVIDALRRRPFIIPPWNARYGLLNTLSSREQTVVYRSFVYESGRALWEIFRGAVSVNEREITCPILVAVGSEDRATPPLVARRIAHKYGADYREYPGECHYLSASRVAIDDVTHWVMQQAER